MKILKSRMFAFILGIILTASIGVLATQVTSSNIGFTPTDNNWNVSTVEAALNDLYTKSTNDGNLNLSRFNNENIDSNYRVIPTTFGELESDGWQHSVSAITYPYQTSSDFELSMDLIYTDTATAQMGGLTLKLYNNDNVVVEITIQDKWSSELKTAISSNWNGQSIYNTQSNDNTYTGKYALVRKNGTLYLYRDSTSLTSTNSTESIQFNKIEIDFVRYPNKTLVDTYIKNIYVGDVKNY